MVTSCSPSPMRAVQRARLWARTCTAIQAALAAKRPEGQMVESHAVLQVSDGVLDLGVSAVVGLQPKGIALAVRDEGVIAVAGKQRQLGTGRGSDPSNDQTHRRCVGSAVEGTFVVSATSAAPSIQ